jgi:hypothetical protein
MRILFRSFAILDLISLVFLSMQLLQIANDYSTLALKDNAAKLNAVLMFPMFWLILIGSYGLFFQKKFGYILYYIQFPFRLFLWIFTIGFITLLPEFFNYYGDVWFSVLLKVCFVGEFIRLYLTIQDQLRKKKLVPVI